MEGAGPEQAADDAPPSPASPASESPKASEAALEVERADAALVLAVLVFNLLSAAVMVGALYTWSSYKRSRKLLASIRVALARMGDLGGGRLPGHPRPVSHERPLTFSKGADHCPHCLVVVPVLQPRVLQSALHGWPPCRIEPVNV